MFQRVFGIELIKDSQLGIGIDLCLMVALAGLVLKNDDCDMHTVDWPAVASTQRAYLAR